MSCAIVGCLVGAIIAGALSDRFGRKRLLTVAALVFALTSVGTALSTSFAAFIAWRMLGGCAIGLASGISPMYIAEISPARARGKLVSLNQLAIVFGILFAQVVNWQIARPVPAGSTAQEILASWNGQAGWRWMFGVTAIPSLLFLICSFLVPESPRWLAMKGRDGQALRVLERLNGHAIAKQVLAEFRITSSGGMRGELFRELHEPGVRKALLLSSGAASM
jgi:MFS family permease